MCAHVHHGYSGCCCGEYVWGGGPECQPRMPFGRRFPTREERIARLEEYLKELQSEAKAVEERLAEMKATA